jgi:hypothetical protein
LLSKQTFITPKDRYRLSFLSFLPPLLSPDPLFY